MSDKVSDEVLNIWCDDKAQPDTVALIARELLARRKAEREAVPLAWLCSTRENVICTIYKNQTYGEVTPLYAHPPSQAGMVSVPREPTEAMLDAAIQHSRQFSSQLRPMQPLDEKSWREACIGRYRAMIDASENG